MLFRSGTFDGKDNYNGFNVNSAEGAVVNIYGGNFLNVHSGSLYGNGTINVMGGFYFDDPTARVVTGYHTIKINDTLYTVMKYRDDAYIIEDAFDLTEFSKIVDKGATFEGTLVKVINDITLPEENWNPIGDNRTDALTEENRLLLVRWPIGKCVYGIRTMRLLIGVSRHCLVSVF